MTTIASARVGLAYWWRHGRWPALSDPRRFTEWVQWRKLNDRDPGRSLLTDKAYSKTVVSQALGDEFNIPTWWLGDTLPAQAAWPMPFIVKANHGCGQMVIVRTDADYQRARRLAPGWVARTYGQWLDEWHYRGARRAILIEPLVGDGGALPIDYKLYVFGGRAAMVQVHENRDGNHRWSQYRIDGTPLSRNRASAGPPSSLAIMVSAAERLGQGHDFLRVDFYEVAQRPLFGEFCLYPGSGLDRFDPVSLDDWLGTCWSAQYPKRQFAPGAAAHGGSILASN